MKLMFLIQMVAFLIFLNTLSADVIKEWEYTKWIWNFAIITSCDVGMNLTPTSYFSKDPIFNPNAYKKIRDGNLVWVRCSDIPSFNQQVLPRIKRRFVLVITDGDESFPSDINRHLNIEDFISSPKIIHIFAQNFDYAGPSKKVSHLPIGLDLHSIAYKPFKIWGEEGSPSEQESTLNDLLQKFLPTHLRIKKAFIDFQHSDSIRHGNFQRHLQLGEDRTAIFNRLVTTSLIDYSGIMRRSELWRTKGQYAFSISPHGNGLDCHRTWEDLILGCIVIVKTSPLDSMYKGLPVVIVNDWSEITSENMDRWLAQYGDAFTNPVYRKKLTNAYWLSKMRSVANLILEDIKTSSYKFYGE
jgi:hypothetical protein